MKKIFINIVFLVIGIVAYFFIHYLHSLENALGLILSFSLIVLGIYLLLAGGDSLVEGSVSLAQKFKISPIVIGLTIVSFGTSAPEFFINVLAALKGENNLLLSNIIGSNLANILLILGVGALVAKKALKVQDNTLYYEIPFSLLAVIVLWILVNDKLLNGLDYNVLSRGDGLILLCFFAVFMYYIFSLIRSDKGKIDVESDSYGMIVSLLLVILGALGLYFGGELVVNNAVWFAQKLGVSTFLIGASIVAIGTSLPELVATIISARKGHTDLAIGNVIGSNIFNILWIGGVSSLIRNIYFDEKYNIDLVFLMIVTIILVGVIWFSKERAIGKKVGILFVLFYIGYIIFIIFRG